MTKRDFTKPYATPRPAERLRPPRPLRFTVVGTIDRPPTAVLWEDREKLVWLDISRHGRRPARVPADAVKQLSNALGDQQAWVGSGRTLHVEESRVRQARGHVMHAGSWSLQPDEGGSWQLVWWGMRGRRGLRVPYLSALLAFMNTSGLRREASELAIAAAQGRAAPGR